MADETIDDMMNDILLKAVELETLKSFNHGSGSFLLRKDGVYFSAKNKKERRICSWLVVVAKTRDDADSAWGWYLQWRDDDGNIHSEAIPRELLVGDAAAVFARLMRNGLDISSIPNDKKLLPAYIQEFPTDRRMRCVERLGWYKGAYVLPSEIIGGNNNNEEVVFQNPHELKPEFSVSGTKEQWREHVAALVAGNSRLTFAVSAAFAGQLFDVAGFKEGGGFHFCGISSKGKTTALFLAASVWGYPESFMRSWRTTSNALEGAALLSNDGLLALDEINQIDPKQIGETVYMLANGQVKGRANSLGAAQRIRKWRTLFLSSGEKTLSEHMREAFKKTTAGQEIRFAEISIGDFEDIHGYETPRKFADALKENASSYFGAVGIEYLRQLVERRGELTDVIQEYIENFVASVVPAGASGQVSRVARRFGLVAVAGELATYFNLTGWQGDEATKAARTCFEAWFENFERDEREALAQVKAFLEANESRFERHDNKDFGSKISDRAGFYKVDESGEKTFYVLPEVFNREVCEDLNPATAVKALINAGWLIPGKNRTSQTEYIPANDPNRIRVYVFTGKMLE